MSRRKASSFIPTSRRCPAQRRLRHIQPASVPSMIYPLAPPLPPSRPGALVMASSLTPLPVRLTGVRPPAAGLGELAGEHSESGSLRLLMLLTLYAIPLVVALRPVASP